MVASHFGTWQTEKQQRVVIGKTKKLKENDIEGTIQVIKRVSGELSKALQSYIKHAKICVDFFPLAVFSL